MDTNTAALIVEAFDAGDAMPPHERFVELDKLLRAEIDRLVTYVQRLADNTAHRTREWYAMTNAIDKATDALQFQLGTGPLAGSLHVAELARRVIELQEAGGTA
ncbi:DUF6415 family natural product biosynthesis protein [Streptomyces pseudovenezuelae]|uniref:DUF6415 family natural product biosynthesis protein n=1 Tax=Streptomyces pseudovenezuelae TaxID=67350 RepID=UPI0036E88A70